MRGGLALLSAAALALRLSQAAARWDEVALAYAAYQQPWLDAAAALPAGGSPGALITTWFGLHPPLYSALFWLLELLWGAPAGWLLLSELASAAAVWLVGRSYGLAAAAVLATDPLQLAYAAEVNNYPLLVLAAACCLAGRERAAATGRWGGLVAAGIFAGWTHLFGGLFAGLCALSLLPRRPRAAAAALAGLALGTAPVTAHALALAGRDGTFGQAGLDWAALAAGLRAKLGWWWPAWPLALLGARRRPAAAAIFLGSAAAVLGLVALRIAAAHQQPYWLLLGPPAAALLGAVPPAGWAAAVAGLAVWAPGQLERLAEIRAGLERPRAIDEVLAASAPGDAVWLLAPALKPDDDKTDTSDVLWRFPPWQPMPAWRGPGGAIAFEYADYSYGQPRWMAGRVVHTTTDLWQGPLDTVLGWHLEQGRGIWFVLYDHGPARDYPGLLARALSGYRVECWDVGADAGLGVDRTCRVLGRR